MRQGLKLKINWGFGTEKGIIKKVDFNLFYLLSLGSLASPISFLTFRPLNKKVTSSLDGIRNKIQTVARIQTVSEEHTSYRMLASGIPWIIVQR